ncbi:MAG: glycosyltransferase family 2 protein [Trueperaceae bacterium]|nr:glycosyltransferase family 2 protein [Trueperaceae bacterium]
MSTTLEQYVPGDVATTLVAVATTPRISVIMPVYNGEDTIAVQLEALASQTFDGAWELIVADNGSTDGTRTAARRYAGRLPLHLIDASRVRGAAHARNVGASHARAPLLAFVDADDEVAPGWLASIVTALDMHPVVASKFDKNRLNPPALRGSRRLAQEVGLGAHDYADFLPHASGSGLAIQRSVHAAIGGFDESLLRLQDTDYCWRAQLAGFSLHFEHTALVHYRFRTSTSRSIAQAFLYGRYDGHLYNRYAKKGMRHVSLWRDLRVIAERTIGVVMSRTSAIRAKRGRLLANRVGIVVGRLESLRSK